MTRRLGAAVDLDPAMQRRLSVETRWLVSSLLAALLAACEPPVTVSARTERVDSAGVEIVLSSEPRETPLRVDSVPDLRIGGPAATGPEQFGSVQGIVVASDGSIWVADRQSADVRVFEHDGSHRTTIGRRGDGPGEFQVIRLLGEAGDSIAVVDDRGGRLSWFDRSGALLSDTRIASPEGTSALVYGIRPDGGLAGVRQQILPPGSVEPGEVVGGAVEFVVWPHPEATPRVFAAAPTTTWLFTGTASVPIPFTTTASLAVGSMLVAAGGTVPEVRFHTEAGLERIARTDRPARAVDTEMRSDYATFVRDVYPETRQRDFLDALEHPAVPDTVPAYTRLLIDSEGLVWAQRFRADPRTHGDWDVYGVDGALVGVVPNPSGLWVHAITEDSMVGVWLDGLNVSYLQRHPLTRG